MSILHLRTLNSHELKDWLKEQNYELNAATRRKFTNVFVVAGLIKNIDTKLIHWDNYLNKEDTTNNRVSWEVFNQKGLSKLRLKHSPWALQKLAKGGMGAIESLLYDIMSKSKAREDTSVRQRSQSVKSPQSMGKSRSMTNLRKVVTMDVKEPVDGQIVEISRKLVAYDDYLKALRKCQKRDQFISLKESTIVRLESTLRNEQDGPAYAVGFC